MRQNSNEQITHFKCPDYAARELRLAGGENPYGEPMFRCVWGYDRIVPMTGEWEVWESSLATLTDKVTGYTESRPFMRRVSSVIETRQVPKYLPANCWHLEMWRPPEEYGSPEDWRKHGEEVLQGMTLDTAGEFPSRGEYELCYPLTHDGTSHGQPIPLVTAVVAEIVNMIRRGREQFNLQARRAAIEQRLARQEDGFVRRTEDILRDALPAFAGEASVTVPSIIEP